MRFLRTNPGFTVVAVGTLGLGIAANTTVFGWIDTVLLRPIPGVVNAHELVVLEGVAPDGRRLGAIQHPDFRDFQRELTQVSGVVASHTTAFSIGSGDHSQRAIGQVVSANFFAVLGVKPFLGRVFQIEEDRDNPGAFPMAVISYRLWRSYFAGDARVVGRTARINGRQLTILGVTPPDFKGTIGGAALDVWVPLSMVTQMGALNTWAANDRNARFLDVIVRLKPGVAIAQARPEAQAVASRIAAAYPDTHRGIGATLVPVWNASYGIQKSLGAPLRLLMAVCLLVLLIACANVANLLMARSVTRQRELGIRVAMGAGRGNLVRLVLIEAALLAGLGAAVGGLLAQWLGDSMAYAIPALDSSIIDAIEPMMHARPNAVILGFCALISLGAAALSTIMPAVFACRVDVNETLKEGGRSGTAGAHSHRVRGVLVMVEVALAAVALIGAGLAFRNFQKFTTIHPGFDSRNVLVAHFFLSTEGYPLPKEKQFCRDLRLRLESAPGIEQVGYADSVPLSLFAPHWERVQVEGSEPDRIGVMAVVRSVVSPGYFSLMRIPLLAGRDFTEQDDEKAPRVIVVNQTFARKYFDGRDPIGRKVRVSGNLSTVVGMVQDGKYLNQPEGPTPFFYGPFRQFFYSGHDNLFYIRTRGDMSAARAALRREVAALDPNASLYEVSSLAEYTQVGLFAERVAASLLSGLGALSLALAAVGLYSVMAYAVSERTQEFGIRMALGARPVQVLGGVLRQGLAMTAVGLVAGVAGTFAIVRLLPKVLDSPITTIEPEVCFAAALCLILIALLASFIPARRATRIDPMLALRSE